MKIMTSNLKVEISIILFFLILGCSTHNINQKDNSFLIEVKKSLNHIDKSKKAEVKEIESSHKKIKSAQKMKVKINNVLIEDFIKLVFSEVLKHPYVLDRSIEKLNKRIDVEINNVANSANLHAVAVAILESYGILIQDIDGISLMTLKIVETDEKNGKSEKGNEIKEPPADCVFTYSPLYTTANSLKLSIEKILENKNSKMFVYEFNNKIIFRSTEKEKKMIIKLLNVLDEKQKLIKCDLTLAEITLTGDLSVGLQGLLQSEDLLKINIGANINNGFGITGTLFNGNIIKTIMQVGEKSGLIKIQANPYLLIADGTESTIEIGSEYPVLKSEQTTNQAQGTIQNIDYRKTGIIINLKPVVAGDSVHLKASIEMSEGQKNNLSNINSPSILSRKMKFEVVMLSDQSLIVGGLINDVKTNDDYFIGFKRFGVPYGLSRINSRSEIVLIVKVNISKDDVEKDWIKILNDKYEKFQFGSAS